MKLKQVFGRKITIIVHVSQFSTGGKDDYEHTSRHT